MLKTVGFPSTRTGDQTIVDGNLVIGTAGKGIDFSADPSAVGMTSELLDDYEEGTWTATLTGSGGGPTVPVTATGYYTKVGRQVTVSVTFANVSTVGASGVILIGGLPFASALDAATGPAIVGSAIPAAYPATQLGAGSTTASLVQISNGGNIANSKHYRRLYFYDPYILGCLTLLARMTRN